MLPTPTLHTARLLLRPFTTDDTDAVFALNSNPRVGNTLSFQFGFDLGCPLRDSTLEPPRSGAKHADFWRKSPLQHAIGTVYGGESLAFGWCCFTRPLLIFKSPICSILLP
jgi:RimJ/RimL family protein N-acetyltransferase